MDVLLARGFVLCFIPFILDASGYRSSYRRSPAGVTQEEDQDTKQEFLFCPLSTAERDLVLLYLEKG